MTNPLSPEPAPVRAELIAKLRLMRRGSLHSTWLEGLDLAIAALSDDAKDKQIADASDYSIQLQRIIEAICGDNPLREDSKTLHHHRMAEKFKAELARLKSPLPRYRHKKRGTEYELIGYGKMQAERWGANARLDASDGGYGFVVADPVDMREVAIYRSVDDGSLWVRPREEFEDGRFELITEAVT